MRRPVLINHRLSMDEPVTAETEVFLFHFAHPESEKPIRLSTDPTDTFGRDPYVIGTRSTWLTDDGSPFLFVVAHYLPPDDKEDAPASAEITVDLLDNRILKTLRSTTREAEVSIACVKALRPDILEYECRGLSLVSFNADLTRANLFLGRMRLKGEPSGHRMNRQYFPCMFR
jgi:hypothetical protein